MQKRNNQERILLIDIARVIAMLWIVCYWHLKDYTNPSGLIVFAGLAGQYITDIMLATFMFISGFVISKNSFLNFKKDFFFFIIND